MAYIDRPLDNSIGTDMTLREGCDLINDNFEVLAIDKLKLDGIEVGAQVNTVTSVAGQTGDVVLTKSDVGLNNVDNTADTDKSVAFAQNAASSETLEGSSLSDVQTFVTNRTGDTSTLTTSATELSSAINELDSEKFDKTGGTISGDVTVSGDLTVNGTSFIVNTQEVLVEDNTITVNNGEVGAGVTAGTAGIVVDRGLSPDYEFVFDEVSDTFRVGQTGGTQAVATREDAPMEGGVSVWNDLESRFDTTLNPQVDSIKFSSSGVNEGVISWNIDEQTVDLTLGNSVLQVGQEFLVNVRNDTASLIPNGTPLMFTGTLGASGRILVTPMDGTNRENYKRIVGFATENIPAGEDGKATALGKIRDIDTTGAPYGETWSESDVIYISPTMVGGLTKVEPSSTGLDMAVAIVVNVHDSVGTLYLRVLPIDRNRISPAVQDALDGKLDLTGGVIPPSQLPSATETEKGVVEKATNAEALSGTVDKFPDAASVKYMIENSTVGTATSAAKWTTARTITLGGSGKSVDGSGNVSWTRSEMGVPMMTYSTSVGLDNAESCIGYISNPLLGQPDGALYSHVYSEVWKHQIQGDYRTGQIALRGKNNGVWQPWRTVIDTSNASQYIMPVGVTYIQFPGRSAPSALFGGTWQQLFNTEGVFFRTEGGNASAFGSGIQSHMLESHRHTIGPHYSSGGGAVVNTWNRGDKNYGTLYTQYEGGAETRPINRTIRVWVRTA